MFCSQCRLELQQAAVECPKCGTLAPRNIAGFDYTLEVKKALKSLVDSYGSDILSDSKKFISFLNDFLPEYEKERRLIKNVVNNEVILNMIKEENHNIAIMKAKEFMMTELFLSENACEFIMECFTYVLGWEYAYRGKQDDVQPVAVNETAKTPVQTAPAVKKPSGPKVFKSFDALKYKLKGTVKIAEGYTAIEEFCFDGFGFIKAVKLPETMVSIGEYAFSECKRLRTVELPSSLRTIGKSAFSSCNKLNMIKIPAGVIAIEEGTFSFCHNLEIVDLPQTVSSIGDEAFSGCEKLRKLFIPESVKFIGENVFSLCPNLVIRCYEHSYVHKYCQSMGLEIELLRKDLIPNVSI